MVVIAGKDGKHSLGTGLASNAWGGVTNDNYKRMINNLDSLTKYLKDTYKKQVSYGNVGYVNLTNPPFKSNQNPGKNADGNIYIHVWGANVDNWNYNDGYIGSVFGAGQASGFDRQESGVFGIVTMPVNNSELNKLNAESNTKHTDLKMKPFSSQNEINNIVNKSKFTIQTAGDGNAKKTNKNYYLKYLKYKNKYLALKK